MLDVLDDALDLVESGDVTALDAPELLELARFARAEDRHVRRQLAAMERDPLEPVYEALFR